MNAKSFFRFSVLILAGSVLAACGGGGGGGSSAPQMRTLTVSTLGTGSVSSDVQPGILNCSGSSGTCSAQFKKGTVVKLTATPGGGNSFQAWGFPAICAAGAAAPNECTVTMSQDQVQIATFQPNSVSGAGDTFALTANGRLISFDRSAPGTIKAPNSIVQATPASDLTAASDLKAIAFRPSNGLLYGFSSDGSNVGKVFVIDPSTASATRAATLSIATNGTEFGARFSPITGNLIISSDSGQVLEWNGAPSGSNTIQDSGAGGPVKVTDAAFTNAFDQTSVTTLYALDTVASPQVLKTVTLSPIAGSSVANLGATISPENGFDIDAQNGVAYVASNPSANNPNLYTLDLSTATLNSVGVIGGGETVRGLALPQPQQPVVFAIFESSSAPSGPNANNVCGSCVQGRTLIKFSPKGPGSYSVVGEVTLPASATVLALAVRPSSNALVALGSDGTLYQVDPLTGAPTGTPHLVSGTGISIDPAQFYGMAFDPATDQIRLVGRTKDGSFNVNYVIDPDTGLGTKDNILQKSPFKMSGLAYDNSSPPANIYAIDYQNSRLFTIDNTPDPLNSGSLSLVGTLSIAPAGTVVNGFEIDSGGNAFAVWNVSATPHLFSIGLNNAAVVDKGAITSVPGGSIASITKGTNGSIIGVTGGTTPHEISFSTNGGAATDAGAITGLSEKVVAIDLQPGSGTLFAVGLSGKIYTIAATLAGPVATPGMTLTNGPNNTATGPYDMTLATNYDMDFDPNTPTTFRLIDDSGRNVTVVASTGVANDEGTLDQSPDPFVSSAAYTHNYVGSTSSTLLVYDASGDILESITPPSGGILVGVGSGLEFDGTTSSPAWAGEDIVGGQDGLALLAAVNAGFPSDDSFTTLYSFDPASGSLRNGGNAVGTVGTASSPSHPADTTIIVRDIAVRFP